MARIAFLGAGNMARGMVLCLLEAGHEVAVYNRTAPRAEPLVKAGASLAPTPAAATGDAEFVIAMVGDDGASRAVWLGPEGALSGATPPGAIAVECSTLSRGWVLALAREASDRGLRYIDCPVTGLPQHAREGALTLLVGADDATLDEAAPVLATFSRETIRFGDVGAGTAYKLVVNLMGTVQIAALAEGLALAEKAGLDLDAVADALVRGAAASPIVTRMTPRMIAGKYDDVSFAARWRYKDASYGLKLAADVGQPMPTSALAGQLYQMVLARGWGALDEAKVIDALR